MFAGKLTYLNKEHMRSKVQAKEGAADLLHRATLAVSRKLCIEYGLIVKSFLVPAKV